MGRVPRQAFRALVFDWDGTAVASRHADATPLALVVDELLGLGVHVIVVTGTRVEHVDRQLCQLVPPSHRAGLLVCANRGSEVFGFTRRGRRVRRWWRSATAAEDTALTAAAEAVRDAIVARTHLDIRIVYDRLNRRKIDLIPVPEWADPPKDRLPELLGAVNQRLRAAGLDGGLGAAVALTERLAHEHGLAGARVTSDAKHVEVGLTDKGDALAWVKRHVLGPEGIAMGEVLIAGDEFGPLDGFAGSDDRLREEADGAVIVSVGPEPTGTPEGVIHLGGGPHRFLALLAQQVRQHARVQHEKKGPGQAVTTSGRTRTAQEWTRAVFDQPIDPAWSIGPIGYVPALEHDVESRFTVANGAVGTRGSLDQPSVASRPRTLVAGLFDLPAQAPRVPGLVPAPNWPSLRLALDEKASAVDTSPLGHHQRTLDLRRGTLFSDWHDRDEAGRTIRLRTLRFASQATRSVIGQAALIEVEKGHEARVTLEVPLEESELGLVHLAEEAAEVSSWATRHTGRRLAIARVASLRLGEKRLPPAGERGDRWEWTTRATSGPPGSRARGARLARLLAMSTGDAEHDPTHQALACVRQAAKAGFHRVFKAHARAWAERWARSDVEVDGDPGAQRALRFATYHLVSAANPKDERISIGARGLTGDAYQGHVFWDTEIFLLPFYTYTWPAAARALLAYRYRTLPAARARAQRLGYRGALYAWESADTGEDATPPFALLPDGQIIPIRNGSDEQHISAAVAYAVWRFWEATEDEVFFRDMGAEIMIETARFWASRARLEDDRAYHIRGVIGPDEYHERVDDNAYTSGMARWNLQRGLETAAQLNARWPGTWSRLSERLQLDDSELAHWTDIAARITTGFNPATGLFEQFHGYFQLEAIDLAAFRERTAPMDVLLGPERIGRSQVIKQADVLMLLALLPEPYDARVQEANFRYYEPRCGHGSSLSPAVHALVAARLGNVDIAERYFREAAAIDLDDTMGNAALGVHMGAQGGLWQAAVFGFGGFTPCPDGLQFNPNLPDSWRSLRFPLAWRGRQVRVDVSGSPRVCTVSLERGAPLRVAVGAESAELHAGQSWACRVNPTGAGKDFQA